MRKSQKVIIFEEVKNKDRFIILFYIIRGYEIYFLRVNKLCGDNRWFKNYLGKRFIREIKIDFKKVMTFSYFYPDLAFDNIEVIYPSASAKSPLIKRIVALFETTAIELIFKKAINHAFSRYYWIQYVLNQLAGAFPNQKIFFIPSNGIEGYRTEGCEIYDYLKMDVLRQQTKAFSFDVNQARFFIWAAIVSSIKAFWRRFKTFLTISGFLIGLCGTKLGNLFKKPSLKKYYKYVVMIISPIRQFANRIQSVDFLIDNNYIKKEEVLFVSYQGFVGKQKKYLEAHKLNYAENLDFFISWKDIKKIIPIWFSLLFSFQEDYIVLETGFKATYYYLHWRGFCRKIKVDNLVSYCDFGPQSVARNILLEKQNCKTYYYMDSINFICFLPKENSDIKYRHSYVGFLYYDYFISWNDKVSKWFNSCGGYFKNYLNLGCFWSQHIKEIKEGKIKSDFKNRLYENGYKDGMKLISVFDGGWHDEFVTTYDDGREFLKGILELLNDLTDVFVVIKEKRPRSYHKVFTNKFKDLLEIYDKLENHKRCYCVKKWENSSEIIAASALTISFPFSSPTFEAVSVRKKATWFDATGKFRDSFYGGIEGLVCHSYEELLKKVKELLFVVSQDEYDNYLDKNIKGKVENYLDGNAINRFRHLLFNNANQVERKSAETTRFIKKR